RRANPRHDGAWVHRRGRRARRRERPHAPRSQRAAGARHPDRQFPGPLAPAEKVRARGYESTGRGRPPRVRPARPPAHATPAGPSPPGGGRRMSGARLPLLAALGVAFVFALDQGAAQSGERPGPAAPKEWVRKVRLSVRVEGDGRDAYLELPLVPTDAHQALVEESLETRGFAVEFVEREGNRLAIVTHPAFEGKKRITYEFTVKEQPTRVELPRVPVAAHESPREDWLWLRPTKQLQSASPLIREKIVSFARPRLAAGDDDALRIAWDLVQTGYRPKADGSRTVLKATRTGHAAPRGQERLFATFLRTSGVPAR